MNETAETILSIPDPSLVLLVGPAGCGKSTFAARHFAPGRVLSSDFFRFLVAGDEADQSASKDAFEALHLVTRRRLARGLLTVIDATNVEPIARAAFLAIARDARLPCLAIVLNLPEELCQARNRLRPGRVVDAAVIADQARQLACSLDGLASEGFQRVYVLSTPSEVDGVRISPRERESGGS